MEPEDEKTLTIARRTRKNLDFINAQKALGADVEEFTQLLNSMLGMVISIREDYFKGSSVDWETLKDIGALSGKEQLRNKVGKSATPETPRLQKAGSFSQLLARLRHAFAHNCFSLIIDPATKQITGVTLWNAPKGKEKILGLREWEEDFSEQGLASMAHLVLEYLEKELG